MHLGNLETKMGIPEITTRKLLEMTKSSLETVVQTMQEYVVGQYSQQRRSEEVEGSGGEVGKAVENGVSQEVDNGG